MSVVRKHLLQIYQAALASVQGESCIQQALAGYESTRSVTVIAIGKAASSMMLGAVESLGGRIHAGLLITKEGHCDERLQEKNNIECLESAHPVPDSRSLLAGQRLLSFIAEQPADNDFLFLISGGASSLVEVLPEGLHLEDLQKLNEWLLGSGWDIRAMNRVRKSLSCIKGGRLAQRFMGQQIKCLMISDVPDNLPQTIGSGFLSPSTGDETRLPVIPEWIKALAKAPPAPLPQDVCFQTVDIAVIATLKDAVHAATEEALSLGYEVSLCSEFVSDDAQLVGQQLARELCDGDFTLHIWGGETTVKLPDSPGRGGRNQQLALSAAIELSGRHQHYFLAAATDGSDGPTQDAGALVDGFTVERGSKAGLDAQQALTEANAGEFLQASNDIISTGPTGTNVMDLMLAIKLPKV